MTREELKAHCEKQIKMCEMWAKQIGEEPSSKIYEEHKLILELLEQEPCEDADVKLIPQPKTGCEGCIYEKTGNNSTYPCSHCGRCYTDKYEAESEE